MTVFQPVPTLISDQSELLIARFSGTQCSLVPALSHIFEKDFEKDFEMQACCLACCVFELLVESVVFPREIVSKSLVLL